MKSVKKKKALLSIALGFSMFLIIGVMAISHDISILRSLFGLGYYRTTHTEEFTSPQDWKTCDVTPKTVITKNESNYTIAVRISYEEYWKAADGTTDLPLIKDGVTLANIRFQNQNDWELIDGYYYYKNDLAPGQSTNSLFEAVQLSCDANLSSEDNICTDTATGQECVQPQNSYSGATYHLAVTVETIQIEGKSEWMPDEEGTLYGEIKRKAQENGTDEDVDFASAATIASGNGNGVNIRKDTVNDRFPIKYYRGQVEDNNVIWGGYCWKIFRTTETGGTKMFYNGLISNGNKCTNNNPTNKIYEENHFYPAAGDDIVKYYYTFNIDEEDGLEEDDEPIGYVGYMYDKLATFDWAEYDPYYHEGDGLSDGDTIYISQSVEYSNGEYHLVNPRQVTIKCEDGSLDQWGYCNDNDTFTVAVSEKYYYACSRLKTTTCEKALYMPVLPYVWSRNGKVSDVMVNAYLLENGDTRQELKRKMLDTNTNDSYAKEVVEKWYEINILGKTFEKDLEDTIFCNDRRLTEWPLEAEFYRPVSIEDDSTPPFAGGIRLNRRNMAVPPTYECDRIVDRFSKNAANGGNGDLKYSIGLMSGDEMVISGVFPNGYDYNENNAPVPFGIKDWGISLTPTSAGGGSGGLMYGQFHGEMTNGCSGWSSILRPTLSLKYGTEFVEGGTGTLENPYVVKQ